MIQVYIEYWKQYFNWSGRTTRKSFWWVFIMNLAIALTLILLCIVTTGAAVVLSFDFEDFNVATYIFGSLLILWSLATLIPTSNLGIRRVRDAGLNPWIWLLSPVSSILGGFNNFPAEIVSDILFLAFLGLALMPSKKGRISSRSQSQGLLIIAIGLIALVGFSVVNLPAKAEHIVDSLPKTNLVVSTEITQKLDISTMSAQDRQEIISLYGQDGWVVSSDGLSLTRKTAPEGSDITVNGKNYQANAQGQVETTLPAGIHATVTTPVVDSGGEKIIAPTAGAGTVKVDKEKTQNVTVKQMMNVSAIIMQMDTENIAQKQSINITDKSIGIQLLAVGLSPKVGTAFRVGQKVDCNDFNAPLTNGVHYTSKTSKQFIFNFINSDCYKVVTGPFGRYWDTCRKDNFRFFGSKYCRSGNGACSALQKMPRTYHLMGTNGRVTRK